MSIDAVDPAGFTELLTLLKAGTITDKSGIEVLRVMLDQRLQKQACETPAAIVDRLNLRKGSFAASAQSGSECAGTDPIRTSIAESTHRTSRRC